MQVLVDLARCQSYGQCVYAAPEVFRLTSEEVLEWEYQPDDEQRAAVVRAANACPVRAVTYSASHAEPTAPAR